MRWSALVAAVALAATAAGCGGSSSTVTRTITTDRLPPPDAIGGVRAGALRQLGDAQAFVDALYLAGDPTKPAARARLEGAGYAGGELRDQAGEDPATGIGLLRTYALLLRDEAAAGAEVDAAVDEVRATTPSAMEIEVPDLPGARGLRAEVAQAGLSGAVVFVTFAAGPYVYGLQGLSTAEATLPQDEIVAAARDLYERVTTAP